MLDPRLVPSEAAIYKRGGIPLGGGYFPHPWDTLLPWLLPLFYEELRFFNFFGTSVLWFFYLG
jgi:hypothetical protein